MICAPVFAAMSSAAFSSTAASRPFMTTSQPAAARASAQPRPSPRLDAQTMALRPDIPRSMVPDSRLIVCLLSPAPASCTGTAMVDCVSWHRIGPCGYGLTHYPDRGIDQIMDRADPAGKGYDEDSLSRGRTGSGRAPCRPPRPYTARSGTGAVGAAWCRHSHQAGMYATHGFVQIPRGVERRVCSGRKSTSGCGRLFLGKPCPRRG